MSFGAMTLLTLLTAWMTPIPFMCFGSLSRSSRLSYFPSEVPAGADELTMTPLSNQIDTSTVGNPRESKTSLA